MPLSLNWTLFIVASSFLCLQACETNPDLTVDSDNDLPVETISNNFLCRMCGASLEDAGTFVQIISPFSLSHRNETVVAKKGKGLATTTITVQKLRNPAGAGFDVITTKKSSCAGVGKWESVATWFPGFSWKPCVCSQCGRHLGWMFEDSLLVKGKLPITPSESGFYGLIRNNILTESVAETLTFVPKIFRE